MPVENLDSNGALVSLPVGDTEAFFFFNSASDADGIVDGPTSRGGRFRMWFTGSASVSAASAGTGVSVIDSNTIEFDCDWQGNKWFVFSGITGPVMVSIVRADLLASHSSGDVFDPEYLSYLPSGWCYRFMDWMGTNNSPIVEWEDYPTESHQTWGRVPVSAMVELCNAKGANPWFCMPHQASADFVQTFAEYVETNLTASLNVRIEKSNEVWNTGVFSQGAYFKGQVEAVWGLADGYSGFAWVQYAGKMLVRDLQIWKTAFSATTSRVIGVIGGQAASAGAASSMADASLWQTYEPTDYVRPCAIAKEISIGPYINWVGSATTKGNTIKAALDISHAAAVQAIKDMLPSSLTQSKTWVDNHVLVAAERNCRLTTYEYNNHYDLRACVSSNLYSGGSPVPGALDAFVEASYSAEMAAAQDELRTYWKNQNGSLMTFFQELGRFSQFGTWGAATHIDHNSAIWNTMKAWHTANPRWWSQ